MQREASVTVNATPEPESLILSYITSNVGIPTLKDNGLTTLDVTLEAANVIPFIAKYSWDFNGDGTIDLECSKLPIVTASYQTPGIYLPTVTITDTSGNTYTDTTIVNVLDKDEMEFFFRMIWNKVK